MKKIIRLFWLSYISLILAGILFAIMLLTSCATQKRKTDIPADWRFRREVINRHHQLHNLKIRSCNE